MTQDVTEHSRCSQIHSLFSSLNTQTLFSNANVTSLMPSILVCSVSRSFTVINYHHKRPQGLFFFPLKCNEVKQWPHMLSSLFKMIFKMQKITKVLDNLKSCSSTRDAFCGLLPRGDQRVLTFEELFFPATYSRVWISSLPFPPTQHPPCYPRVHA